MKSMKLSALVLILFVLVSCEKEKTSFMEDIVYNEHGIFVINEGAYSNNNGSVSYIPNNSSSVMSDVFKRMNNNIGLGDIVQSMYIYNGRAYIVVNNSHKVEVVDIKTFKSVGTITGFLSPRYFLAVGSGKAFVSDWMSDNIKVVDLNTLTITSSIPTGAGPEQLVVNNNKAYITNVGGFGNDSTVTIVDITTNTVIKTLEVGLNPNSIISLPDGKLFVLCGGTIGPDYLSGTADDVGGKIVQIDPAVDTILKTVNFPQAVHPVKMTIKKESSDIYFLSGADGYTGKVCKLDTMFLTNSTVINGAFYGVGVNPDNGNFYCGRPGFSANSYVLRFTTAGSLIDSLLVGIGPNGFVFN